MCQQQGQPLQKSKTNSHQLNPHNRRFLRTARGDSSTPSSAPVRTLPPRSRDSPRGNRGDNWQRGRVPNRRRKEEGEGVSKGEGCRVRDIVVVCQEYNTRRVQFRGRLGREYDNAG